MPNPKWRKKDFALFPQDRDRVIRWFNDLLNYTTELENVMKEAVRVVAEPCESLDHKDREELHHFLRDHAIKSKDFRTTTLVAAWISIDRFITKKEDI